MNQRKARQPIVRLLLFIAVFAYLPGRGQAVEPEPTIRLGYRPKAFADVTPVIMKEAHIPTNGFHLELVPISSPPDGFTKLEAGEVDALAGMPLEIVFKHLNPGQSRRPFRAYALQNDQHGAGWVSLVGSKDAGIKNIGDLAGKTAASLPTDQAEYLLRSILRAAGVPPDQIRTARYNVATALVGLRTGEHAAIFGLEPAISQALSEGNTVLVKGPISHFLFNDRPVPVSASLVADDLAERNPEALAAFRSVVRNAMSRVKEEPDRVRSFS